MKLRTAKKLIRMDLRGKYVSPSRLDTAWNVYLSRRRPRRPLRLYPAQVNYFSSASSITGWTGGAPYSASSVKFDYAALREALDKIAMPMTPISAVMLPSILESLKKKCEPGDVSKFDLVGINIHTRDTDDQCRALAMELRLQGHKVYLFTTEDSVELGAFPAVDDLAMCDSFSGIVPIDRQVQIAEEFRTFVAPPDDSLPNYINHCQSLMISSCGIPASILEGSVPGSYSAYSMAVQGTVQEESED